MKRLFILINLILLLAVLMFLVSCNRAKDPKEISIGYVNWSEGIAMSYLTKAMLEEQGYKVTLKNADIAPIFTSVAAGKVDLFLDAWLPDTHVDYMKKYGDRLETIGIPFENARLGLAVPSYVTINTIEELNANKERFKGEIIGIDIGASLMNLTEDAVNDYGLQLKLMPSSGPTMTAFLQKSVEHNDWIVVTGWTPPTGCLPVMTSSFSMTTKVFMAIPSISQPLPPKASPRRTHLWQPSSKTSDSPTNS